MAGAELRERDPVFGIDVNGGRRIGLVTASGRYRASTVVLAAGQGAVQLSRTIGVNLPIQMVRSSVARTSPAKPFTRTAVWGPTVAYRPRPDGSFIIGNGYRGVGADYDFTLDSFRNLRHFLPAYARNWRQIRPAVGEELLRSLKEFVSPAFEALPEPRVNGAKIQKNFEAFQRLLPHLTSLTIERKWSGRIDLTPDLIPVIDRPIENVQLYIAAGFSGHGFGIGPSAGKQIAEWILCGRTSIDLTPFRLSRFGRASHAVPNTSAR